MPEYCKLHGKREAFLSCLRGKRDAGKKDFSRIIFSKRKIGPAVIPSMINDSNRTEKWASYTGIVSCVSVPNKTVYVRRNGVPVWSGNSDPPMNWRISQLDRLCLVSNSDAHSAWPWRLGREANVFDLDHVTYQNLVDAIREEDSRRL